MCVCMCTFIHGCTFHYSHKRSKEVRSAQVLQRRCTTIVSEMRCNMWQRGAFIKKGVLVADSEQCEW